MKKIGLRNIKTALAVMISMIVIRLIGSNNYFYAGIAAVISMQISVYDSFKIGRNRMIGTTIGVCVGITLAFISPGNILLVGIGIVVVIYLCNIFKFNKSITIACIVFIAIMVNLKDVTPMVYGISRLLETFLGIVVAVFVNYVICPNESLNKINVYYDNLKAEVNEVFKCVIMNKKNENFHVLKNHIAQFENLIKSFEIEYTHISGKEETKEIIDIKDRIELFKEANINIKAINYLKKKSCISNKNIKRLNENFSDLCVECQLNLEEKLQNVYDEHYIVYNYHINRLIDIMEELNK